MPYSFRLLGRGRWEDRELTFGRRLQSTVGRGEGYLYI